MTKVYKLKKDNDHINMLGEQGWDLVTTNTNLISAGFPVLVAKEFRLNRDCKLIDDVAVRWLDTMANKDEENVTALKKHGFWFSKVYSDVEGKKVYRAVKKGKSILNWRIEVNYGEDEPIAYLTFGHPLIMTPALANKEVIDKYVPKEIIDKALESGALFVAEVEETKQEVEETIQDDAGLDKGEQREN